MYSDVSIVKGSDDAMSIEWNFDVSGNSAWGVGFVPESSLDNHSYIVKTATSGLLNSDTGGYIQEMKKK